MTEWKELLEKIVLGVLALVGMISSLLLGLWIMSLFTYVFSDATYPGAIAYVPHWIFLGAPLIFLIKTRPVKRLFERLERVNFL